MGISLPLKIIPTDTKINFVSARYYALILSAIITIGTIIGVFTRGLNLGIDFNGGILIECSTIGKFNVEELREAISKQGYTSFNVQEYQSTSGHNIMIRVQPKDVIHYEADISQIKLMLQGMSDTIRFERVDYVGPKVGNDFVFNAIQALGIALVVMMIYTWIRFEWQFGIGVIIALLHDCIATIGFYVVSGYEFDLTSIAAILTIIGYSINDSVVIYDRIRENLRKHHGKKTADVINISINETLSRTIMTVATTLIVCLMLILFGGETLKGFSTATFFGITFGTYSSIYISAPVLTFFGKRTTTTKTSGTKHKSTHQLKAKRISHHI
ncbi:Protein translocase subunit SecF [Alphaproteobacteria bacterium]